MGPYPSKTPKKRVVQMYQRLLNFYHHRSSTVPTVPSPLRQYQRTILVNRGNSTCKSGSLRRPHATYRIGAFEHTFLTLQKKQLLSKGALDICTRAGPKTLPKKVQKNSFGGPSRAKKPETGTENENVCVLQT